MKYVSIVSIDDKLGITTKERLAMDHHEYYQRVIDLIGYEKVKDCVPYTLEEIKEAYPKDEHLNNLPMKAWDVASGFHVVTTRYDQNYYPINSHLRKLLKEIGINSYSNMEGVCILKECARMMLKNIN
jgi:hypothetical protein